MIAALYVETDGCYFGLPDVDPWDEARDARRYDGPHPVVAHPPCQRWGRYWHGSPRKPHQFKLGADGGCFEAALASVRRWGGVLEHPADSHAWSAFGLAKPPRSGGWIKADDVGGSTCYVEQGFYGHFSRKGTWLYANKVGLPELKWGQGKQRLPQALVEKYDYKYARRCGMIGSIGGKNKTKIRNATPVEFRDLLLSITRSRLQPGSETKIPGYSLGLGAEMKIIAFDLGKNLAWSHTVPMLTGRKFVTGHVMIDGQRAHRLAETMKVLTELLTPLAFDLDAVVYETPFARGRDATRSLWGIAGMIEACATNAGLPVLDVAVPTIKKFATGHGKACKEDMIAAAKKFGYKGGNEHEADAVCLLRYAEANFERVRK